MSADELARPERLAQRVQWQQEQLTLRRADTQQRRCPSASRVCKLYKCERCGCGETRLWRQQRKAVVDRYTQYAQCVACNFKWELA